ncbi:DUF2332 domain-containing protein [Sphingomonas cavernae]|uniref:DUF2332 family protein n=1 Tax=Sphingomonas cavernae TaxID=2320861 RepID=A0A418WQ85_9SPHN|nr:DUF2332 family protein [Sphingomonas cavernae]RJF93386.1 DUF2332 family protein [Sphingomonas cavernae]
MASTADSPILDTFRAQAEACRQMAAPLTARIIDAAADLADDRTRTGRRILGAVDHSGYGEATGLRLAGGLHALARSGDVPKLSAFYAREADDAHAAVAAALAARDAWLERWLDLPPQTNETARSAAVMAGLLVAARRFGLPFRLFELGSSAGLNLNLAHYRFDLGGVTAGDPDSPLAFIPEWRGATPPAAPVTILASQGVDIAPIATDTAEARERLIAYMWIDQPERIARIETALAIAKVHPPRVAKGDAADWTEARMAEPVESGVMRVLFHTIAWQYFPDQVKARVRGALEKAGALADEDTPLGWLRLEINDDRSAYELRLTMWPGGEEIHLADAHPYCAWVAWRI